MQLRDITRFFASNVPAGPITDPPQGSAGSDGETSAYDMRAMAVSDINPLFSGRTRFMVYNEMRYSDPTIAMILAMFKLPIRQAQWDVVTPEKPRPSATAAATVIGSDPIDNVVADAVRRQFGLGERDDSFMSQSWDEWLLQRALMIDLGAMFEEILWGDVVQWTDGDGDVHPIRPIARMAPRYPSTVDKIDWDGTTGAINWIKQDLPNTKPIPGNKLACYINEREGTNWMGKSVLRPMYGAWKMKRALMLSSSIAWDRWASGIPVVRYPKGTAAQNKAEAQRIGRNVRVHELAFVDFEGTEGDGWSLDIKQGDPPTPVELLQHYDQQMSFAALQGFTQLGITKTGSRAVGQVLADPYYLAVRAIGEQIALDTTRQAVRRFVDVNFGEHITAPRVVLKRLSQRDVLLTIEGISLLAGAGFNVRYPAIFKDILDQLGLDMPEAGVPIIAETGQSLFDHNPGDSKTPFASDGKGAGPAPGQPDLHPRIPKVRIGQ